MIKTAIITGAGSGVGRATAIKLAKSGWKLVLNGRNQDSLAETQRLAEASDSDCHCIPGSVADVSFVNSLISEAEQKLGTIQALVNSAGTNTPQRRLEVLALEDYHDLVNTNLHGSYYTMQAVLPGMRKAKSGTIVNVVSDAALWGMPLAGAAYTVSKFGLRGLTQTINAEENANGIRACGILPGEIDTPILKLRPEIPTEEHRASMLHAEDVADCVVFTMELPGRAVVQELLVRPCR